MLTSLSCLFYTAHIIEEVSSSFSPYISVFALSSLTEHRLTKPTSYPRLCAQSTATPTIIEICVAKKYAKEVSSIAVKVIANYDSSVPNRIPVVTS
jgi:hypothetical protein